MTTSTRSLAARLREVRQAASLSVSALAREAHVSRQTIIEIENGKRPNPTLAVLRRIARACGVRPEDLIAATAESSAFDAAIVGVADAAKRRGIAAPTPDEIAMLHDLPTATWIVVPPDADVLVDLIETARRRALRES